MGHLIPGKLAAMILVTLMLTSCGGSSGTTSNNTTLKTGITAIVPAGVVASTIPQSFSLGGTNFSAGMSINVTNKNGNHYTVNNIHIMSATVITFDVTLGAVPADNYVNITVMSSNGAPLSTAVLGVAGTSRTLASDIQPIFDARCITCHDGSAPDYLDLRNFASAANLISTQSSLCSNKFRVTAGDPRRSSSVLLDKLQADAIIPACSGNPMPPAGSPALSTAEIQAMIDWVATGAN